MILGATGASPQLLIELGLLLIALALMARLATRLQLSPIPFYLLLGLAAGQGGVADLDKAESFIEVGAQIGVVLLLFFLGLEYSARELVSGLRASTRSGLLDLTLNLTPGVVAALVLGWGWEQALLLGGVTYISSSGIVSKLLSDLHRSGNRETPAVISVLVFEDLVMAVYLPIVAAVLAGGTALEAGASVGISLFTVVIVLALAWKLGPALSRAVFSHSAEALLFGVLGITLLVAGVAEAIEVSAAVGAFLVGIALSGPAAEHSEDLIRPLRDLFAAAFFLFFALEIDPADLPVAMVVAFPLAVATGATKILTGWYAAGRLGVATRGRMRAGTTLVARGEFSIVIAGLAVAADGEATELGEVAAAYVLLTAVAGPLLARYSDNLVGLYERRKPKTPASATTPT